MDRTDSVDGVCGHGKESNTVFDVYRGAFPNVEQRALNHNQ